MSYTPSIRERVLQAIQALLAAPGTPAANTFRVRLPQIIDKHLPCFDVDLGEERVVESDADSVRHTLACKVRAIVAEQTAADSALDVFYVWAVGQILADHTLGGLVISGEETGSRFVFRPEDQERAGLEIDFTFEFDTLRADPATAH